MLADMYYVARRSSWGIAHLGERGFTVSHAIEFMRGMYRSHSKPVWGSGAKA